MIDEQKQAFAAAVQTAVLLQRLALKTGEFIPMWHWIQCVVHAVELSHDEIGQLINKHGNMSLAAWEFCAWNEDAERRAPCPKPVVLPHEAFAASKETWDALVARAEKAEKELADQKAKFSYFADKSVDADFWRQRALKAEQDLEHKVQSLREAYSKFSYAESALAVMESRAHAAEDALKNSVSPTWKECALKAEQELADAKDRMETLHGKLEKERHRAESAETALIALFNSINEITKGDLWQALLTKTRP